MAPAQRCRSLRGVDRIELRLVEARYADEPSVGDEVVVNEETLADLIRDAVNQVRPDGFWDASDDFALAS